MGLAFGKSQLNLLMVFHLYTNFTLAKSLTAVMVADVTSIYVIFTSEQQHSSTDP